MSDDAREWLRWLEFYRSLGVTSIDRQAAAALAPLYSKSSAKPARPPESGPVLPEPRSSAAMPPKTPPMEQDLLKIIRDDLGDCTRCRLHSGRTNIVFGSGNPRARLMFVGEGPGADEDEQGLPFVGRAGQLLTKIIESIELSRDQVYIANVVKCRPPQNRNPEPDEIATCSPFLFRQIEAINPEVICALGKFGAQTILQTDRPIGQLRGKALPWRGRIVVPTYHPSYLLRNPSAKREVWEDMKLIRSLLK